MKKLNYFSIILYFLILLLNSCSFFKNDNKDDNKENKDRGTTFVQTVAKPDSSLRGLKVSLPKPVVNNTWEQLTNNEAHRILHPLVDNKIKFFWKTSIGKGQNKEKPISSQPVIDQQIIYTLDTALTVTAINKKNGKKKWVKKLKKKVKETSGIISGGLAVNDNLLAVTTGLGNVFALNKNNGKIIWTNKITAPIRAAPIISGNLFLVLAKDNRLYAYNLTNGDLTWTHEGLEETSTFMGSSSPVVSKGIVVVTYSSGEIYAINLTNGEVIWSDSLSKLVQKKSLENNYTEKLKKLIDEHLPIHKIYLNNGSVIEGTIENDLVDNIMVKTDVGRLTINKNEIENIEDLILSIPNIIFIGHGQEEILDNYHLFTGKVLNKGGRRGDFVRVIYQLWGENTKIINSDSVFVVGSQIRYKSGIVTDTALEPNQSAHFIVKVSSEGEIPVSYVTRQVRWLSYD